MDSNELVARNVKRFRLERGLSLGDVARRSGLSKQTLSKLESGVGNPTVETLSALGSALDVSLRRLMTEWGTPVFVQRVDEGEWAPAHGHEERPLDEIFGSGYVRTTLINLNRTDRVEDIEAHPPGTLHHVYVVVGRVRLGPTTDQVELSAGDFVRYPGDVTHRQACLSEKAVLHVVTTLPQVRQFTPTARPVDGQ
ncbi:XRE family transcriptional regulator [Nocardioides pocheonensis]|uniref:XRE family transcriptional regulator n=1 Tax=Nocardioides pocheonensis TaxID=661485 RepID=A0A3N0GI09_9ACTN|nr:XRE family transcriptional regulator [Nocardioides pocheonensis]RNM12105.1 XRE family transcriptional regulator [Nocardioides pocheonensis]